MRSFLKAGAEAPSKPPKFPLMWAQNMPPSRKPKPKPGNAPA